MYFYVIFSSFDYDIIILMVFFMFREMDVQKLLTWVAQKQIYSMRERNMVSRRGELYRCINWCHSVADAQPLSKNVDEGTI